MKYRSITRGLFCLLLLLAACATREPGPEELRSKRFETVPDKAVVYLYRDLLDFSNNPTTLTLDGQSLGSTYPGTYYRLELPPGRHRIAGFAGDAGAVVFDTQPGKLYFMRHVVSRLLAFDQSFFHFVGEIQGRNSVSRYELLGAP
ncbi:MAG: DUF2846 domain-containing protein [Burkholderiales bacterium]|nr:DUF2846 domain-containing protein [Burkholderiales bacterium]